MRRGSAVRGHTERVARLDVDRAYCEHGQALLGFAVNSLGDRAAAEDVVQEVFVRAWRSADRFDPTQASERTWLFAIARNLVIDYRRASGRRPEPVDPDTRSDRDGPIESAEEHVVNRMQVTEALARISPEHREVIVALHLQGSTYAELAERTGVAVATLRTRMFHGLRAMRSILDETGGTHGD